MSLWITLEFLWNHNFNFQNQDFDEFSSTVIYVFHAVFLFCSFFFHASRFRASAVCSAHWRWSGCSVWVGLPVSWTTTSSMGQLCWCCWCACLDWPPTGWPAFGAFAWRPFINSSIYSFFFFKLTVSTVHLQYDSALCPSCHRGIKKETLRWDPVYSSVHLT